MTRGPAIFFVGPANRSDEPLNVAILPWGSFLRGEQRICREGRGRGAHDIRRNHAKADSRDVMERATRARPWRKCKRVRPIRRRPMGLATIPLLAAYEQ